VVAAARLRQDLKPYKALLQAADEHRRGSLDGRGNLTQAGLVDWIGYTLDICIDQVAFMARQLDVQGMRGRIHAALAHEVAVARSGVRLEALNALHYLFATQAELGRADFKTMTGLGERVATATISALLARGFVTTDSPYGALRFGVPRHALRFYFPALVARGRAGRGVSQRRRRLAGGQGPAAGLNNGTAAVTTGDRRSSPPPAGRPTARRPGRWSPARRPG
jgi:hypothetical protein